MAFDPTRFVSDRALGIDASGIRRVFDLAASLENPINLSIGQPDFAVPDEIREAAVRAMEAGLNGYTQTQGIADLRERITQEIQTAFPEVYGKHGEALARDQGLLITSGVSGGLMLVLLATCQAGDEVIIADPYFVMYKHLVTLAGATPVLVDTYPDFQVTAERVAAALSPRTKLVLFNTPCNPTGVVATPAVCRELALLCESKNVLLVSDEIYDLFCFETENGACPSPLNTSRNVLLLRGFSKSYAMTGWRLGYAAGPLPVIEQMTKLQQYSFVCAPSMVQAAGATALDIDLTKHVEDYRARRDLVVERLSPHFELTQPGGAFYAFPRVPQRLGLTGTGFVERCVEHGLLVIPGSVFSASDTHFRLSYACDQETLDRGLDLLIQLGKS